MSRQGAAWPGFNAFPIAVAQAALAAAIAVGTCIKNDIKEAMWLVLVGIVTFIVVLIFQAWSWRFERGRHTGLPTSSQLTGLYATMSVSFIAALLLGIVAGLAGSWLHSL